MRPRWRFSRRFDAAMEPPPVQPQPFRILHDPEDLVRAMQRAAASERRLAARIEARATWYDQRTRELTP